MAPLAAAAALARMVVEAARRGAAALGGRGRGAAASSAASAATGTDSRDRLERWRRDRSPRAEAARGLARSLRAPGRGRAAASAAARARRTRAGAGAVLALAFPDRIAKARGRPGEFLLANGRAAARRAARRPWPGRPSWRSARSPGAPPAPASCWPRRSTPAEIEAVAGDAIGTRRRARPSIRPAPRSRPRRTPRLGALVLGRAATCRCRATRRPPSCSPTASRRSASTACPGRKALAQWRDRVAFLRARRGRALAGPVRRGAARATAADWLAPFLARQDEPERRSTADDLGAGAATRCCPARWPAGSTPRRRPISRRRPARASPVDYEAEGGPAHRGAGAGTVRPAARIPALARRPRAADAAPAVAGASADPDHPRPAGLLARLLGGGEVRDEGPLSAPPLARRSRRRRARRRGPSRAGRDGPAAGRGFRCGAGAPSRNPKVFLDFQWLLPSPEDGPRTRKRLPSMTDTAPPTLVLLPFLAATGHNGPGVARVIDFAQRGTA